MSLTPELRAIADHFERGALAPDGTTVAECQRIAAWYLDTGQDGKAWLALQEAKRLGRADTKGHRRIRMNRSERRLLEAVETYTRATARRQRGEQRRMARTDGRSTKIPRGWVALATVGGPVDGLLVRDSERVVELVHGRYVRQRKGGIVETDPLARLVPEVLVWVPKVVR